METQKSLATARRNLWQRIDRYLAEMETAGRQPTWREGDKILEAMTRLEAADYPAGERAMMWADVATRRPDAGETHPTATVQILRQQFAAIDSE